MKIPAVVGDVLEALGDRIADIKLVEMTGGLIVAIPANLRVAAELLALCSAKDEGTASQPLPPTLVLMAPASKAGEIMAELAGKYTIITSVTTPSVAADIERAARRVVDDEQILTSEPDGFRRPMGATPRRPAWVDPRRN